MLKNARGVSLAELMIAMVIMTAMALGAMASFKYITKAISQSRTKTIANNIAQEKIEVLKNYSYFQLRVTTDSASNTDYTPNVVYDPYIYPPETIALWGMPRFTRSVFVAYADMSGTFISTVSASSNDTGLKLLVVHVTWKEGDDFKKVELRNLFANPSAASLDSGFQGKVTVSGGGNLAGALVQVVGNPNWKATSDSSGDYSFQVAKGTYSLSCSSAGYYTQYANSLVAPRGSFKTQNFSMVAIASGTIAGQAWYSPNLLISQIVASTGTTPGNSREFIVLYNPTTYTWTVNGTTLEVIYKKNNGAAEVPLNTVPGLTFNVTTLSSQTFYLIASTSPITINGTSKPADAQYLIQSNIIQDNEDGGIGIRFPGSSSYYDRVAWRKNPGPDPPSALTEGTAVDLPNPPYTGLMDNMYILRKESTGTATGSYGTSYDTDDNSANFTAATPLSSDAQNSTNSKPSISGRPAHGAFVTANDGLSRSTTAVAQNLGTATEYAQFTLTKVATGTWSVVVTSGAYTRTVEGVSVLASGARTDIPNAATSPAWPVSGFNAVLLTSASSGGFIQGYVFGAGAAATTPLENILMEANGVQARTSSSGYYFLNVATGAAAVNANLNLDNDDYVSAGAAATVAAGAVVTMPDFNLATGATIKGYVSANPGALPNIVARAALGVSQYSGTSDETGYFYITVPANAAAYTITADLDQTQSYTTAQSGAVVDPMTIIANTAGTTVFAGTITVTGGMGTITGTVKKGSDTITTGVLIIASTGTIADPPAAIYGSSAPALSSVVYSVSSSADGTYSLETTAGSYNMSAYYPIVDTDKRTVTYSRQTLSAVSVTAGETTPGKNFTW